MQAEDPATPGSLRGDRVRWYVGNPFRVCVLLGPPFRKHRDRKRFPNIGLIKQKTTQHSVRHHNDHKTENSVSHTSISHTRFGNALNPQGITTRNLNNHQCSTYGGFHLLTDRFITRLGVLVFFYRNAKTSSIMSPDVGDSDLLVKPKSTSAHHHRSIRPSQDWGFLFFLPPTPRLTCL